MRTASPVVALIVFALAAPAPAAGEDWPQFKYDGRHS